MERNYKITIPAPCTENWDKMTPNESGRFCMSCVKTVVDFTEMSSEEIKHFFVQNQFGSVGAKICGRFKKSQLDSITIQIPSRVLYSQTHYHKMFLLALFVAMGTTLFSCSDKDGNKQKIDKVEVVEEVSVHEEVTGKALKSSNQIPPPPPKIDATKFIKGKTQNKKVKFYKPIATVCGEASDDKSNLANKEVGDDSYVNGMIGTEVKSEFPGGIEQFYAFFANEFNTPENFQNANKKIRITFAVEKDGSLNYIESGVDNAIKEEIIRVLKLSPKWKPGESSGKTVRMVFAFPIVLE